jgi:hypothetical protein
MSLGQWLRSKVFLKRNRPGDLKNNTVSGSSGISTKFENNSLKKYLFVAILALIVAPIAYLLPEIQRWASATTWQTASNFDTAGDVGLYGSSILDNDGLISTTYYDKTNTKVKYAQRGAGGTWMVEDVETLAADYTGGVNSDRNTKFGIAKDPSDNKISVAYCEYASGGIPAWSELRIAHRVGGGAGNCGTSNNWQCSGAGSAWNSACAMRMISLSYSSTSTYPALSYIEGTTLKIIEKYDGTNWTESSVLTNAGLVYDQNQTVLKYLSNGAPIIFFVQNDGGANNYVKYTYRSTVDWTWSAPATIMSQAWNGAETEAYSLSVIADGTTPDLFHVSGGLVGNLKYATLDSSFVVSAVTTVDTGSFTWNSIMLQSNGYPAIGYYDNTGDALKYAAFNGATWATETAASLMGRYVSAVAHQSSSYPALVSYDQVGMNAVYLTQDNEPSAPTIPYTSTTTPAVYGATNPIQIATTTPSFSAIFQDSDVGDTSAKAQIQLTTATDGFATINIWDSGATAFAPSIAIGARSAYFKYGEFGDPPLFAGLLALGDDGFVTNADTNYYWRIRFWDQNDVAGAWSATNTFTLLDRPAAPSTLTLSIPYPYTVANSATTTKNNAYTQVADSVVLSISTNGSDYTTISTTTIDKTASANGIVVPTDIFALDTKYYFRAHYYNSLGYSNSADEAVFNAFREPVITTTTQSCNSLGVTAFDPHFNGSSSFGFQYRDNVLGNYFSHNPSSTNTLTPLTPGGVYSVTVYLSPFDLNAPGIPTYGSSSITGQLLACTPNVTVSQTAANTALVSWDGQGSDSGVYYIVKNITTNEQATVLESNPHNWSFTGLEGGRTYDFSVQSYNSAHETTGVATAVSLTMSRISFGESEVYDYPATGNFKVYQTGVPAGYALSEDVLLDLTSAGAGWLQISNSPDFTGAQWMTVPTPLIKGIPWKLYGVDLTKQSTHMVYVKLLNLTGQKEVVLPPETIIVDPTSIASPQFVLPQEGASVGNRVIYSGTAKPGVLVRLSAFDRPGFPIAIGETTTTERGFWTITSDATLSDGMHIIEAVSVASDGKVSIPAKLTIYVNAVAEVAPQAPVVEFPKQGSTLLPQAITTTGFAEPFAQIIIKNYSGLLQDIDTVVTDADATGKWSVQLPVIPSEGFHSYSYYAKNAKGLMSNVTIVSFHISTTVVVLPEEQLPVPVKIIEPIPPIDRINPPIREVPIPTPITPLAPPPSFGKEDEVASTAPTIISNVVSSNTSEPQTSIEAPTVTTNTAIEELKTTASDLLDATISIFNPNAANITPVEVAQNVATQSKVVAKQAIKSAQKTAQTARVVIDTPEVQTVNKAVVIPTAAAVGVASVSTAANVPQILLYFRFLFTQPFALINRRRRKQWGMVYNAITKIPIDLAVVRLVEVTQNRVMQSKVTDRAGRYQFFAEPGRYKIEVSKNDFNFPPTYLQGKKEDGNIADLYVGTEIIIEKAGPISFNIPLDPIGVQKTTKQVLKEAAKKHVAELLSVVGLLVTGISFVVTPTPVVGAFLVAHVGSFFLFRRLSIGKRPTGWGIVLDASDREPLERAVVRIFDTQYSKLLETQVTDNKGRYGFLVGKNQYYVMAEHPGHKKFVSDPVEIKNEKEGGIVGIDISLLQDSNIEQLSVAPQQTTVESAVPQQKIQYVAKPMDLDRKEGDSLLMKNLAIKTDETPKIPHSNTEDVALFARVAPISNRISSVDPSVHEISTSKLLAPISFASNNLKIVGIEKKIDQLPQIISDGNFLDGLDKKI